MTSTDSALKMRLREIFDARDRKNMRPTIDAFLAVLVPLIGVFAPNAGHWVVRTRLVA